LLSGSKRTALNQTRGREPNLLNVNTEPRQSTDAKGASTSGNRIKPVRLTLAMMLAEARLDAFLQSWNGLRRPFKKDDQIPAILLIFCKWLDHSNVTFSICVVATPGAHIDESKFCSGVFGLNSHHPLVVFRSYL